MAKAKTTGSAGAAVVIVTTILGNVPKAPSVAIIVIGFSFAAVLLLHSLLHTKYVSRSTGIIRITRIGIWSLVISGALVLLGWWSWPEKANTESHLAAVWKPAVPTMSLDQQEMLRKMVSSSQRVQITVFIEWGSEDLIPIAQQFGDTLTQAGMDVAIKRGPSVGPLPSGLTVIIGQHANGLAMAIISTLRRSGVVNDVYKQVGAGSADELTFIFVR